MTVERRLVEFVAALRDKGVDVGPSDTIDAARVIDVLGLTDRALLREGLAAALVRRGGQREVFDPTFDLFFPLGVGAPEAVRELGDHPDAEQLRDLLAMALADRDDRTLAQLAQVAVDALGGVGTPGTAQEGFSAHQTLDRLRPQSLISRADAGSGRDGGFTDRLTRDEVRREVERFRELVGAEARRRTAEIRGRDQIVKHAVSPGAERIDFLSANARELAQLRVAVAPLARKLATRLVAKRRRRRRGRIDMRRTLRRAMGTGGVPMRPVYEVPRPSRPELVLVCDVSGSVAGFSTFTMLLVKALSDQFSKVRVFAFVNAMADVTELVRTGDGDLAARILSEARVTKWHTSSDYGEALLDLATDHLDAIGPRSAVMILGDARNNQQAPRLEALHQICERSRRTFWLNPEHPSRWGTGDSIADLYAEIVPMHQCSNVEQLGDFVTGLL